MVGLYDEGGGRSEGSADAAGETEEWPRVSGTIDADESQRLWNTASRAKGMTRCPVAPRRQTSLLLDERHAHRLLRAEHVAPLALDLHI